MKRSKYYLIILALILGLVLVACGGGAAEEPEPAEPAAEEAAEEEMEEEEMEEEMEEEPEVMEELECSDPAGCVEVAAGDPIKLASALVITGPNESLGLDSQYGVEIAIADRGEIMGHEIVLQAEDDGCSAEGGQTAGQKIVSDPSIAGVVGTSCSGAGVPMSQIVCGANIVMVSPSNTAPVLTGADTRQSCYFRTAHNDQIQGKAMADFVFNELGITKAAAIHDGDPYTEGLASVFRDSFIENGGEIVAFEAEAADATNVEPLLTSVAAAGPELIYYPVFIPLGSLLTKTAQEIDGLDGVILAAADGVLSPDFIEASGDAAEGMYMSGPDLGFGNDIYTNFLATYESTYGTEPTAPFHAHAYDATNMILDAIEAVAQVDGDGNMLIGRQALIDQVGSTSGMSGITGTLSCDEFGDCADARIAVNQVQSGEFVPVASAADTVQAEVEATPVPEEEAMAAGECAEDLTGETIVLYQQAGREGPIAGILGEAFAFATEDGINAINADGGVCGASFEVVFEETNYNVELEVAAYEKFRAADPKPIVLFTYASGATVALKDRVNEDKIVNFAAGVNGPAIYVPRDGFTVGDVAIYSDQFAGFVQFVAENWADIKPEGAGDDPVIGVIGWANAYGAGATTEEALAYAESIGVTVLPLEEQEISPEADVSGQIQNMLIEGANVIYNQNLSFSVAQVIGTVRALGVWDSVVIGGVSWSFNNDVLNFLGDNQALADGYYGVVPHATWNDTELEVIQEATAAFEAGGYPPQEKSNTYLLTYATFFAIRDIMVHAINNFGGYENLNGETFMAAAVDLGTVDARGLFEFVFEDQFRAPRTAQIRQWQAQGDGTVMDVPITDFFVLPDTRPPAP
ncbi:MAG: ABC transporter substrate-binding protein [Chloroflexota bacterium]